MLGTCGAGVPRQWFFECLCALWTMLVGFDVCHVLYDICGVSPGRKSAHSTIYYTLDTSRSQKKAISHYLIAIWEKVSKVRPHISLISRQSGMVLTKKSSEFAMGRRPNLKSDRSVFHIYSTILGVEIIANLCFETATKKVLHYSGARHAERNGSEIRCGSHDGYRAAGRRGVPPPGQTCQVLGQTFNMIVCVPLFCDSISNLIPHKIRSFACT
jgi:hypothetical protein